MKASIVQQTYTFDKNNTMVKASVIIECSDGTNSGTKAYDLTPQEIVDINADVSGTSEVIKQIALRESEDIRVSILAQTNEETKETVQVNKNPIVVLSIIGLAFLVGAVIFFTNFAVKVEAKHKFNCKMFSSQQEAQRAFEAGARYLDTNRNGVACQSLLKK